MTNAQQLADQIIEDEGLDNTVQEDNQEEKTDETNVTDDTNDAASGDESNDDTSNESEDDTTESESENTDEKEEVAQEVEDEGIEEAVSESKTFLASLKENGIDYFDQNGNVRKFEDAVPFTKYALGNLNPVKVTDKDGKSHEFLLISDVEQKFPEGFEAKNNIEQMKFERAIMRNEDKFDKVVEDYKAMGSKYAEEVGQITQSQQSNRSLADEYHAMAKEGLVPEVGDPKDPNFKNSDAVKEMNSILEFMNTKNAEFKKKGLGQITSLYVAKQMMGNDPKKEKAQKIDQERKGVASLSRSPESKDTEVSKPRRYSSNPALLADQIIAEEKL